MISAVKAARCFAKGAMIKCSLFTTARIPTILFADSEVIFLSEYSDYRKIRCFDKKSSGSTILICRDIADRQFVGKDD